MANHTLTAPLAVTLRLMEATKRPLNTSRLPPTPTILPINSPTHHNNLRSRSPLLNRI